MKSRFFYWLYSLVHGAGRRLRRRFSNAGLLALIGLAVSALFGLDTNRTMVFQIFVLLFFLLAAAIIASRFSKMKAEGRRTLPRFATAGDPIAYRFSLVNKTKKKVVDAQVVENQIGWRPDFEEFDRYDMAFFRRGKFEFKWLGRWLRMTRNRKRADFKAFMAPDIPPGGRVDVRMEFTPVNRGPLHLSGLILKRPDPFGLFFSETKIKADQSLMVLPKRYPLPPLSLPGLRKHQPGGVALAGSVGDSEEFISLREYRPGDPLRRIHWASWAKTGAPIVKEYQEEFFVRHALVLDTFLTDGPPRIFEEAVSAAASFAASVDTQESLLDLMFIGLEAYVFTAGRGVAHTDRMLEILASVDICRDKPFSDMFPLILERAALLSGLICIFVEWDDERRRLTQQLRHMNLPIKVLVVTDEAMEDDLDPGPMKDQPHHFHQLTVGRMAEGLASL